MKKMDEYGCDLFLDIHGDEEIPFNFLAGSEGIPSFNARLRELQNIFSQAFVRASPDFQPKNGYTVDEPGKANLAISSNGVSPYTCILCTTKYTEAFLPCCCLTAEHSDFQPKNGYTVDEPGKAITHMPMLMDGLTSTGLLLPSNMLLCTIQCTEARLPCCKLTAKYYVFQPSNGHTVDGPGKAGLAKLA